MNTRIHLVRHGKTLWNEQGKIQGWTDIPLSALGKSQAQELALLYEDTHIDAIYSSTLSRAYHTAKPVADSKTMNVVQIEHLKEGGFGVFEGLTWDEVVHHPLANQSTASRYDRTTGGGESIEMVYKRASSSLDAIVSKHPNETIIVVSHGLVMKTLALHMGFVSKDNLEQLKIHNATPYIAQYSHRQKQYLPIDFPLNFYRG